MVATPVVVVAPLLALGPGVHTYILNISPKSYRRSGHRARSTLSGYDEVDARMTHAWQMLLLNFQEHDDS
jgi:hypothetical protein